MENVPDGHGPSRPNFSSGVHFLWSRSFDMLILAGVRLRAAGRPPVTLLSVSHDLYFWPTGVAVEPGRLADQLAEEEADGLAADERVLAFRAELLRRWPELTDMIAPWHHDLDWRQSWGGTDLADRFVAGHQVSRVVGARK
jgi:hypothetical protein